MDAWPRRQWPAVGESVHVRDEERDACRPATVTDAADPGGIGLTRLRVIRPAAIGEPVGSADDESFYPHHVYRQYVPTPGNAGGVRWLDSWHRPESCRITYPPAADAAMTPRRTPD